MNIQSWKETIVGRRVTYTLEMEGKFIVIENVPARVCEETGEQLFSSETVEKLQKKVWNQETPKRMIETPVYDFAA
ncbi:MAG: YgiT-type zinc finger protein [Pyrinomonadaceae bacterium]